MTCPECCPNAAKMAAMAEELAALRALVDGTPDEQVAKLLAVLFELEPRCAKLVTFLWTARGRHVPGGLIADTLWPESGAGRSDMSLRVAVSRTRKAMGKEAIETVGGSYRLGNEARDAVTRALPPSLLPTKFVLADIMAPELK